MFAADVDFREIAGVHGSAGQQHADRQHGLMFRQSMPAHEGMLFVFEQPALQCFWMKNTLVPLTIAFIAGKDEVVDGPQCRALLEKAASNGADIEIVYYEDVNHVFDFRHLEGADRRYFNEAATLDAEQRFGEFLQRIATK